jgi:hypothetical protein
VSRPWSSVARPGSIWICRERRERDEIEKEKEEEIRFDRCFRKKE